jgi:hypothetical protein
MLGSRLALVGATAVLGRKPVRPPAGDNAASRLAVRTPAESIAELAFWQHRTAPSP